MTKRFYKDAAAAEIDGGYCVQLDGKSVKTPQGSLLVMKSEALADAVAEEWNAQGDEINPKTMALTPLVGTAIDRVPGVRDDLIEGLLRYGDTDLLCYRATHPEDLTQRQAQMWQPLLDWAADELGARLTPTEGIVPISQSAEARAAFKAVLDDCDDWTLTALGELVGISGSLVLGLALVRGHINVSQALAVCHVDEDHQNETWGLDHEAKHRRENVAKDITAAYRFFELLKL